MWGWPPGDETAWGRIPWREGGKEGKESGEGGGREQYNGGRIKKEE